MPPTESDRPGRPWRPLERGLLLLALGIVAALLAVWAARPDAWWRPGPRIDAGPAPEYANRLDPNAASWQSLARLPGVGEIKAKAIVQYRDERGADGPAFRQAADLAAVPGIGPAIVEKIAPFLAFSPPASQPEE